MHWLKLSNSISDGELGILVDEVPRERITEVSAEFAKRLPLFNKRRLAALVKQL